MTSMVIVPNFIRAICLQCNARVQLMSRFPRMIYETMYLLLKQLFHLLTVKRLYFKTELFAQDSKVKCDKIPIYEEDIVDVEVKEIKQLNDPGNIFFKVCEDTPRTVCRDTNVLLPKLICTHYLDDRLIFDSDDDQRDDLD